jgi:glycosyltransferase involved in cell wall biosynthesis
MEILFLADNFPPECNAQASLVYERACYWVKWGARVTVLTCAPNFPDGNVYPGYKNDWYRVENVSGIRVIRVRTFIAANAGKVRRILDYLSFMVAAVIAGLFQPRPDIIVATSPQFFAAVGGWLLAFLRGLPFVMEVRDLWPDSIVAVGAMKLGFALRCVEKLELHLYRQAVAVVVLTPAFRDNLVRRGVPPQKVHVIMSGVDLSRYSPGDRDKCLATEWRIEPNHFVIGYIGTLGMAHGLRNVLDAAQHLTDPHIRFLLVGTGQEREELIAESRRRGINNIIFVPAQPKQMIRRFWSLCDVSLVHLRNAPLFETVIPSKIFESMGMGLSVLLAAPKGQASEIVDKERMGICVPAEDPQALAVAANELKLDEAKRQLFARNSLAAAARYSREQKSGEMLTMLNRLSADHRLNEPETMTASLSALAKQLNAYPRPTITYSPQNTEEEVKSQIHFSR